MIMHISSEVNHRLRSLMQLIKRREQNVYKSFYSLAKAPFSKDMGSTDAFRSVGYQEALNGLEYLQKSKGIGLMIGDPGVGKTFTLRSFKVSSIPALFLLVNFPCLLGVSWTFIGDWLTGWEKSHSFEKWIYFVRFNKALNEWIKNAKLLLFSSWMKCIWQKMHFYKIWRFSLTFKWILLIHSSLY